MRRPQLRKNAVDGFPVFGLITVGLPVPALSNVEPSATFQKLHGRWIAAATAGGMVACAAAQSASAFASFALPSVVVCGSWKSQPAIRTAARTRGPRCSRKCFITHTDEQRHGLSGRCYPPMVWISWTPISTDVVVRSSPSSPVAPFDARHDTSHTIVTVPW
jgi:hypothetical protein